MRLRALFTAGSGTKNIALDKTMPMTGHTIPVKKSVLKCIINQSNYIFKNVKCGCCCCRMKLIGCNYIRFLVSLGIFSRTLVRENNVWMMMDGSNQTLFIQSFGNVEEKKPLRNRYI